MDSSHVRFLLAKGTELIAASPRPDTLPYGFVSGEEFDVAVGCINEFGQHEIVGVVASVRKPTNVTWRITSHQDGYNRLIGAAGEMHELVRIRLATLFRNGSFGDLANLPQPVIIVGDK